MGDDIFEKLNDKQREAVLETEGYVRVIAGAGSGKTKLLVSRYAYLVRDYGIDSANILCVTFTNKAAGEMKKRIRALIGDEYDTTLICTYHGFCNRLLRENSEKLFLNKQFQIIDGYQQKAILTEIYQKFELKLDYASFESILHKLGAFKSIPAYVPRICSPTPCQIMEKIETQDDEIMEEFMQRQKATYSLDFNDLIAFALHMLENHEDVRTKWQERLNYVMVDEFQDSSSTEMKLIEILSEKYGNLLIVGDPDQNIYEWRGSDVKLLVDFDKEHMPTKTIFLNQNYRSTPEILKCANTLIEKNELRLKKDLFTQNPSGAAVRHYHSKNDFEEMDQVIDNIKKLSQKEGFGYSDFAILYRSGFLSRIAEKKLVERNIPYEIFGGVKFYQRMEILDILAYLKLIAFDDDTSFKRIVNTPRRRFGRAKLSYLEQLRDGTRVEIETSGQMSLFDMEDDRENKQTAHEHASLFATLKSCRGNRELCNDDICRFIDFVDEIRQRLGSMRISEIVNATTSQSGYEGYIRGLGDEERLDNLAEFKRISNEFEREFGENLTLEEFLQQIALQSGEDEDSSKDTVKLMTIHSAKGLEFPVVFILGFTEGIFPSSKTMEERKKLGLEEERRLCYVAITRAEKHLFLMDSEGVSPKGIKKLCSRFLDEIGEGNYERIGKIPDELLQESRSYISKLNRENQLGRNPSSDKNIGDAVEHHVFGSGVITGIDEKRGSYVIRFDGMAQPRSISKSYFDKEHKPIIRALPAPDQRNQNANVNLGTNRMTEEKEMLSSDTKVKAGDKEATKRTLTEDNFAPDEDEASISEEEFEEEDEFMEEDELEDELVDEDDDDEHEEENGLIPVNATDPSLVTAMEKAKKLAMNSPNLWKREDVPHQGWHCTGVEDLGAPIGICEMCGYQIIRYAHHMEHSRFGTLVCGCICAGKMEGNIDEAKRREADLKNKQARKENFLKRKWKSSKKGNDYLKVDGHVVVIFALMNGKVWKYSIDNEFSKEAYKTREEATLAVFVRLSELNEASSKAKKGEKYDQGKG